MWGFVSHRAVDQITAAAPFENSLINDVFPREARCMRRTPKGGRIRKAFVHLASPGFLRTTQAHVPRIMQDIPANWTSATEGCGISTLRKLTSVG